MQDQVDKLAQQRQADSINILQGKRDCRNPRRQRVRGGRSGMVRGSEGLLGACAGGPGRTHPALLCPRVMSLLLLGQYR